LILDSSLTEHFKYHCARDICSTDQTPCNIARYISQYWSHIINKYKKWCSVVLWCL